MVNRREEHKAETRKAILSAAALEFATRGYGGTSFATIAAAMGRPKSAVGHHQFASKQEIAVAITEQQYDDWRKLVERAEHVPPGLARLLSVMLTMVLDAEVNPFAAATVRLLTDAEVVKLALPPSVFSWRKYGAQQIQLTLNDLEGVTVGADEVMDRVLVTTLGVWTAKIHGIEEVATSRRLMSAWGDMIVGLGLPSSGSVLERVARL
ncbi:TetR/AcrR family transcriptional regulator [Curtobacterium sp. ZW137]|uniref:TetR/AcrR family transcriptional regulator n=1 Tax=Curtobacterium sp. ZW137 TaxID=2485104 RepID=UPI001612901A|nr:TetR/AcrR family transcriptional regulator [Curtobacterium sp. ZW137]